MPDEFLNPYHFVPVEPPQFSAKGSGWLPLEGMGIRLGSALSHAVYSPDTFSGRIVCRLRAETPLVVGGRHKESAGQPTLVEPFKLNGPPAIPASSLRGMVSSVFEVATNSALRVLHNRTLKVRIERNKQNVGEVHGFFRELSKELLPYNRDRDFISPAEQVFGFVADGEVKADRPAAYAGRVCFGNGHIATAPDGTTNGYYLGEVTLKELSDPKPPCPVMYFQSKGTAEGYIAK